MSPSRLLVTTLLVAVLAPSCASFPAWKGRYIRSSILVVPPRDVVQNGTLHEKSPGSGLVLMTQAKSWLEAYGWTVSLTDDAAFSHRALPSKERALAEAARLGSDYVLLLELGEFRNAAPMTFRSDFVTLNSGVMYHVSGETVWRLQRPLRREKSNFGNHLPLITAFGNQVGKSIASVP